MSKYKEIETQFTNADSLRVALETLGVPFEVAHGAGLHLYGYQGDKRPEVADFVVRRQHIEPAANDLGFARAEDGTYRAILSEFDGGKGRRGAEMLRQVKREYTVAEATRLARLRGYSVERTGPKNRPTLRVVMR